MTIITALEIKCARSKDVASTVSGKRRVAPRACSALILRSARLIPAGKPVSRARVSKDGGGLESLAFEEN